MREICVTHKVRICTYFVVLLLQYSLSLSTEGFNNYDVIVFSSPAISPMTTGQLNWVVRSIGPFERIDLDCLNSILRTIGLVLCNTNGTSLGKGRTCISPMNGLDS